MPVDLTTITRAVRNPIRPATVAQYDHKARLLIKACLRERRLSKQVDPTPAEIAKWLVRRKTELKPSTWQLYKSSLLHRFEAVIPPEDDQSTGAVKKRDYYQAALAILRAETQSGTARKSKNTSATKLKKFSEPDRLRIAEHLAQTRSSNAALLNDFLLAGVRCGLRVVEWATVQIVASDDPDALIINVVNAKEGETRAHGPTRTLRFRALPASEREAIQRWLTAARKATSYEKLRKALSDLLYTTCRALWPRRTRHLTLYSSRHEFAAVAKLAMSPEEVAAVMGHASDVTATNHYGRYRNAGTLPLHVHQALRLLPVAALDEVEKVRRVRRKSLSKLTKHYEAPAGRELTLGDR